MVVGNFLWSQRLTDARWDCGVMCGAWIGPECQRLWRKVAETPPVLSYISCLCGVNLGGAQGLCRGIRQWGWDGWAVSLQAFLTSSQKLTLSWSSPGDAARGTSLFCGAGRGRWWLVSSYSKFIYFHGFVVWLVVVVCGFGCLFFLFSFLWAGIHF